MKKIVIISTFVLTAMLNSCGNSNGNVSANIDIKKALELAKNEVMFVDVRSEDEISELAYDVKNLINVPLDELEENLDKIPKDKQVVLVCRSGNRSGKAYDLLNEKGYTQISSMDGGILAWEKAGYPTKVSKSACCADPSSKNCNPDGTCKTSDKKEACCADPTSKNCNPDGTCKTTEKKGECCSDEATKK